MKHVLLTLFRSLSFDLLDGVREVGVDRRNLRFNVRKDIEYVRRRLQGEGPAFVTLTIPRFAKHVLASLEAGSFAPIEGYKPKKGTELPCFMHGWLVRIFDPDTGSVLDCVDPFAIKAIRQLLTFASKAKDLPSSDICRKAFAEYEEDDHAISQESLWSTSISTFGYTVETRDQHFTVDRRFGTLGLIGRLFVQTARTIGFELDRWYCDSYSACGDHIIGNLKPKHGPGAVFERLDDDGKWRHIASHCHHRLGNHFPHFGLLNPEDSNLEDSRPVRQLDAPSRLIAVPKTSEKPRLIASEPVANQFWQQALNKVLNDAFDGTWLSRSIDLKNQAKSQDRAWLGSVDRSLGTIDLSKASDSVTLDHVGALFQHDSQLLDAIMASRTERMLIPLSGEIRLRKFASMGSAVCFPIETAIFLAAVAASIISQLGRPVTSDLVRSVCRDVTVYGDDIIAPTRYIPGIMRDLRTLGFTANASKSFYRSYFRESCGADYYAGEPVKPVYLRVAFWTRNRLLDSDVASLVKTSRLMFDDGLWRTAEYLLKLVETRLGRSLPYSEEDVGYLTHNIPWRDSPTVETRWNEDLQILETQLDAVVPKTADTSLDGYARLLRYLVISNNQNEPRSIDVADHDWSSKPIRGSKLAKIWTRLVA